MPGSPTSRDPRVLVMTRRPFFLPAVAEAMGGSLLMISRLNA
jgi:hypothetical protein